MVLNYSSSRGNGGKRVSLRYLGVRLCKIDHGLDVEDKREGRVEDASSRTL